MRRINDRSRSCSNSLSLPFRRFENFASRWYKLIHTKKKIFCSDVIFIGSRSKNRIGKSKVAGLLLLRSQLQSNCKMWNKKKWCHKSMWYQLTGLIRCNDARSRSKRSIFIDELGAIVSSRFHSPVFHTLSIILCRHRSFIYLGVASKLIFFSW